MSIVKVINSLISEQSVARSRDSVRKLAFITFSRRRFTSFHAHVYLKKT